MRKGLLLLGIMIFIALEYSIVIGEVGTVEFHEIDGEVVSIDGSMINIHESGVYFKLKLAPQVKIYCNGMAACWEALRPISVNAFFDARIILNQCNQVVLLDGSYQGEECIIQGWRGEKQQLYLKLVSVSHHQYKERLVKNDALLPRTNWLFKGQLIYVLYNREGEVRGVYLPD